MSAPAFDVAVVIPVHNGADFLAEAIDSVLAQDHPPIEIVVVDDGSTDGTVDVAKAAGPRVRVISQAHAGAGVAKNLGMTETSASWIAFLDADDRWTPDKLSRQREALEASPDAVAVIGLVRQFFDARLGRDDKPDPEVMRGTVTSALVIRREVLEATGGFPTNKDVPEFAAWWVAFTQSDPQIATADVVVIERRIHGQNVGLTAPDRQSQYLRIVKDLLDRKRDAGS